MIEGALPATSQRVLRDELNTRATLLLRLRDRSDQDSWAEFVEIYTPLLYAYCQKREINSTETADIVQDVFRSISLAIQGFDYDPSKGRFKAWLFTVLRNAVSTHFRKASRAPMTSSETQLIERLEADPEHSEAHDWDRDYQVRLLHWAMEKIQPEFSEQAWTIFTETALKERAPQEVAEELGMQKNAVTVAKYRVMQRLRRKLESIDAERWEQDLVVSSE